MNSVLLILRALSVARLCQRIRCSALATLAGLLLYGGMLENITNGVRKIYDLQKRKIHDFKRFNDNTMCGKVVGQEERRIIEL